VWWIRKFVRTARRYRTIEIRAGAHAITAADPYPTTSTTTSTPSPQTEVCTNLSQVESSDEVSR
jgi:hypothetical protein